MRLSRDIILQLPITRMEIPILAGVEYPIKKTCHVACCDIFRSQCNSAEINVLEGRYEPTDRPELIGCFRFNEEFLYVVSSNPDTRLELTITAKEPGDLRCELYIPVFDKGCTSRLYFKDVSTQTADLASLQKLLNDGSDVNRLVSAVTNINPDTITNENSGGLCRAIINYAANVPSASIFVISMPAWLQAEMSLFSNNSLPGIDRTAYFKATPKQMLRYLAINEKTSGNRELIVANYPFSKFQKEHWEIYLESFSTLIEPAKKFLLRNEQAGGFSDNEICNLALRNPCIVDYIPTARLTPNTVIALLISGKASNLWKQYDFTRLAKEHWRELFLHTNPDVLPEACRPFVENKDGTGFSSEELLNMARSCHPLINFLDPNVVPFNIAYELYLTGKADILWRNYPFAQLDKSEWRKILTNPQIKIPPVFTEIARGNRFKQEELLDFALRNDRMLPVLIDLGITPDKVIDLLLKIDGDYIWANFHFSSFKAEDWERLILGLKSGQILKPAAMAALANCKQITEAQATRILNKDIVYCPHLPLSSVSPDMAVEILCRGKGYFLWEKYDFSRLSDALWLKLLNGTTGNVPEAGIKFLHDRAAVIDNGQLNVVLARRENLIEHVDQKYISPDLIADVLSRSATHELWKRCDFSRFSNRQLCLLLTKTSKTANWPESLINCFKESNKPLSHGDLLEVALVCPSIVISLISTGWVSSMEDEQFDKLVKLSVQKDEGLRAIKNRLESPDASWKNLSVEKLKRILMAAPSLRTNINWNEWPFAVLDDLVRVNSDFEKENKHQVGFFLWKHFKSLAAMLAITVGSFVAISLQNAHLDELECQRKHYNNIVDKIHNFNHNKSYEELSAYLGSLSSNDLSVVGNDVFVKRAKANLDSWDAGKLAVMNSFDRLRQMADKDWESANQNEVRTLFKNIDEADFVSAKIRSACSSLREKWNNHLQKLEREAKVSSLRISLESYKSQIPKYEELDELKRIAQCLDEAILYTELKTTVGDVRSLMEVREKEIKQICIAKSVDALSNGVARIQKTIKGAGGFAHISEMKSQVAEMKVAVGFDKYSAENPTTFIELDLSLSDLESFKDDIVKKKQDAEELAAQFKNEFMTIDAGNSCSNLLAACDEGIAKARQKGGWHDPIAGYQGVKRIIDGMQARDLACWNLIDKLNGSRTYADYLSAREDLLDKFGEYPQVKGLRNVGKVSVADSYKSFRSSQRSYWGGNNTYKFHFVGVIRLAPDNPASTYIDVNNKSKVTAKADLYTLLPGASSSVASKLLIQQVDGSKYYKVDNVDYTDRQGTPLFVKSEHYRGED